MHVGKPPSFVQFCSIRNISRYTAVDDTTGRGAVANGTLDHLLPAPNQSAPCRWLGRQEEQEAEVLTQESRTKEEAEEEGPTLKKGGEGAAASFPHPLRRHLFGAGRQSPARAGASAVGP